MDTNPTAAENVKNEFGAKYAFTKEEDLLALDEIDAVYIATPVFCHKKQVMMAADAKKHILLEKPMGLTVEEAKEIRDYCTKAGISPPSAGVIPVKWNQSAPSKIFFQSKSEAVAFAIAEPARS